MTETNDLVPLTWAQLFHEAVERFGDDLSRIQSYVSERIADLPGEDRARLEEGSGEF